MPTYPFSSAFLASGAGVNGLTVNAYDVSRFGSAPAFAASPPSGSPDATAATGTAAGFAGAFTIELPSLDNYYLMIAYGGQNYWMGPISAFGTSSAYQGLPLGLTGATAATRYVGGTTSAAPTTGPFVVGDFEVRQDGGIEVCTTAGTPGSWKMRGGTPSGRAWCTSGTSASSGLETATLAAGGTMYGGMLFDSSGATGLQVPVKGRYQVNTQMKFQPSSATFINAFIGVNGTLISYGNDAYPSGSYTGVTAVDEVDCNAGDVINLGYQTSVSGVVFQCDGPGQSCFISAHLVAQ